ncbi:filamentous hemagglutinin N-terminal domain-containing protein, partial [Hydrogenophaga sp. 5NK40-0174]|uniref:two-partner secretion domain-containing protein n=1 Tax=Hydrogenophaga sp. 5NK40-0174 TaxID=3127649 RepID=UPI003342124F
MNKGTGRKVFNKARGCMMLVAETAKGAGKGGSAGRGESKASEVVKAVRGPSFTVRAVNTVALSAMLAQTMLTPINAMAQIRSDRNAPGAERPTVLNTANGLPQINITTPSGAGVSRNQLSQMDVDRQGAVVNNSRTNVETQLGGWVQGNPWLGQGEARVILLQVNSNNPSQINGYVEIAGQRAEIVVANPAGLSVNGSGFINASRATLTTGQVEMSGGDLRSYTVSGGKITIGELGFDASLTDYTGILARAVEVNGPLHAKDLQVVTGTNKIDADHHDQISSAAASGSRPSFSLDVSRLGGMYAGKITLVGTEAGVGVRNAGAVQAGSKGLTLNTRGDLVNSGALGADGDADIQTAGKVDNSGTLFAEGNANVQAGRDINNEGTIRSGGHLEVSTPGALNNPGFIDVGQSATITATSVDNSGALLAGTDATIVASESLNNSGYIGAGNTLSMQASDVQNSGMLNAGGLLDLQSGSRFDNEGSVIVQGSVHISAPDGISNAGAIESQQDVRLLTEQGVTNAGTLIADGSIAVQAGTEVVNTNTGFVAADNGITIAKPDVFINEGQIFSGAGIDVEAGQRIENPGLMVADGSMNLQAGDAVTNAGQAYAAQGASVTAGQTVGVEGLMASGKDLNLQTSAADGTVTATDTAVLAAGMDTEGYVLLGEGVLTAHAGESETGQVSLQGTTLAGEALDAKGGSVHLRDQVIVSNRIDVQATAGDIEATGASLQAVNGLSLNAAGDLVTPDANLGGKAVALTAKDWSAENAVVTQTGDGDDARMAVSGKVNAAGIVLEANATHLAFDAQSIDMSDGLVLHSGAGKLQLDGEEQVNVTGALVATAGDLEVRGGQLLADDADLSGLGKVTVDMTGVMSGTDAIVSAGQSLSLGSASAKLDGANVTAQHSADLSLGEDATATEATLAANEAMNLKAGSLSAQKATVIGVSGDVAVNVAGAFDLNGGALQSERNVALTTAGATDVSGATVSGERVAIETNGNALDNTEGTIMAFEDMSIRSGQLSNDKGIIQASTTLTVDIGGEGTPGLTNRGGQMLAGETLAVQAIGHIDNSASTDDAGDPVRSQIASADGVSITAGSLDNRGSDIKSAANVDLLLEGGQLDNSDNGLIASSETLTVKAGSILNVDTKTRLPDDELDVNGMQARQIDITTEDLDNTRGGIIAAEAVNIEASGTLNNTDGLLSAGTTLTVKDPLADPDGETNVAGKTLDVVNGTDGIIASNGALSFDARSMVNNGTIANAGQLVEQGDGSMAIEEGDTRMVLSGNFTSGDGSIVQSANNLELFSDGSVDNSGTLESSQVTTVSGANVRNRQPGAIRGGLVDVRGGAVTNYGLINGNLTLIQAGALNNRGTGRIYGDHIAISAGSVTNAASGGKAPVIASREDLDFGVGAVTNSDGALILALGDMRVGGSLDDELKAKGTAGGFVNSSAEVDVFGNVTINAGSVANVDGHGRSYNRTTTEDVVEYLVVDETLTGNPADPRPHPYADTPLNANDGEMDWRWDDDNQKYAYFVPNDGSEQVSAQEWWIDRYTRTITESGTFGSDPASFSVGGNLKINAASTVNDKSSIIVGGNLTVRGGDLQNISGYKSRSVDEVGTRQLSWTEKRWYDWERHHRRFQGPEETRVFEQQTQYEEIPSTVKFNTAPNHGSRRPGAAATVEVESQTAEQSADTSTETNDQPTAPTGRLGRPGPGVVVRTMPGGVASAASVSGAGSTAASSVNAPAPRIALPNNSLFQLRVGAPSGYLVETDPEFTMERRWLGSSFMLEQLGHDPATVTQRLGDGFYEQKLVREQVAQLTGRRFLGTFTDDEEQYRALLTAGAEFAEKYRLKPGIALTQAQMAALTSDIVWLVEKTVKLPDGKVQKVLVPQLYALVDKKTGRQEAGLISAKKIDMKLSGDVFNTGTLNARKDLKISATNITNILGSLNGRNIDLRARGGLTSILGDIAAKRNLRMRSGGDTVIIGGAISAGGSARLSAGGNFSLLAYDTGRRIYAQSSEGARGPKWRSEDSTFNQTGTKLNIGGGLSISAGKNIVAQGVQGNIGGGASLRAGENISLSTAQNGHVRSFEYSHKYDTWGGTASTKVTRVSRDV